MREQPPLNRPRPCCSSSCPDSTGVFGVPAQCPEPAFLPLGPESRLGQILCFKHRRRVARDNTVKYYRHTLQLLPSQQRRSYAGAVVVVLEGLDGRLSLQHEGRIIASQEAPPSPASLRSHNENFAEADVPAAGEMEDGVAGQASGDVHSTVGGTAVAILRERITRQLSAVILRPT